jgi:hypothetical protein
MIAVPFRSRETLEAWLAEFRTTREGGNLIEVIVQAGDDGADTGLVIVPLRNEKTEIYMQPTALDSDEWSITLGPREGYYSVTPLQLSALVAELAVAASLCQFLHDKSLGHVE